MAADGPGHPPAPRHHRPRLLLGQPLVGDHDPRRTRDLRFGEHPQIRARPLPGTPPETLRVVNRGIDPARYPHGYRAPDDWRESFHQEFPETRGRRLVTLPGRITRLKGHEDLIEVLRQLPDPQVHALVVGGTHPKRRAYLAESRREDPAAGLSERITFTGPRRDLREILAISDVVLSLTLQPESFGRTTLEALGLGRPVVGYGHGGVAEQLDALLPEGKVPPGDTSAAARTIRRFLDRSPTVPAEHPYTLQAMLDGTLRCLPGTHRSGLTTVIAVHGPRSGWSRACQYHAEASVLASPSAET